MELWERLLIVAAVILGSVVVAKLVDRRISRSDLPPQAITRYRVLRRSIMTAIIFIGILSALLVVPQVRAIAGGRARARIGCKVTSSTSRTRRAPKTRA